MDAEQKIYTVGDAHLDTSWVWTFETSVNEYIPKTLNENFSLFEKYPEYKFNFEGSYRYELMEEYYPEAFEKVKEYVKEGKWCPCGSCYENGDVNIPSPEALIRNVIYGNGYFRDKFGVDSNDIFLPDCFGFGKALPGVAAHCNIKGFSTQKLTWGCSVPIPFDVGKWSSLDGKYLWCALKTGNYTSVFKEIRTNPKITEKLERNSELFDFNATMEYHGVGDRGGAPKEESVRTVVDEIRDNPTSKIKVLSASTKEFFDDVDSMPDEAKDKMPVHDGEFLMTEHGAGSYTTRTVSKRFNRRCELLADAAERSAVSAYINGLADYPQNVLDTAWKRTIAHQFHDDITGTSWMIDYKRNWNDYVQSLNNFSTEYTAAVKAVTGAMDTSFVKGIAVAVSSPVQTSSFVNQAVSVEFNESEFPRFVRVFDSAEKEVPSQISFSKKPGNKKVTFMAKVPANGIAVYDIRKSDVPYEESTGLTIEARAIENKNYIVKLDTNGDISSVFDKRIEKELLSSPIRLELLNDFEIYHYSAWEVKYKDIMSKPYAYFSKPVCFISDNGPALCSLEIIRKVNNTVSKQVISLDAESDFIRVFNEVDWRSESSNLKVRFPVSSSNEYANYDIGLGYYRRKNNTPSSFEVPAQRWADITSSDGEFGVSVLSDSRVGWDKPNDNTLRLTAVHTATNNHSFMTAQHLADFGINRFSFGIYGHKNNPDFTACAADRFCQPMHAFICDIHKGNLPSEYSLCSVSSDTVRILGIKKAQKSDEIVIRLCEYTGNPQKDVKISFSRPVISAREITGDEQPIDNIDLNKGNLVVDFKPHQIISLALTIEKEDVNIDTVPVELSFDVEASSYNGENKAKLENGFSIPAELIPDTVYEAGVLYKLKKDGKNALACRGQSVNVPEGAKSLHLLITSVSGDRFADFKADGSVVEKIVQDCFEAVGAWDMIGLGETGYIKKQPQYYTFTHTHSVNGDEIAKQFYIFHAEIPCEGCSVITLPHDPRILIFAASFSTKSNYALPSDEHFDSLEKRAYDYSYSKYAKSSLSESKFTVKMNALIKRTENHTAETKYAEERKNKRVNRLKKFKDFGEKSRLKLRVLHLKLTRL